MPYRHTQVGTVILAAVMAVDAIAVVSVVLSGLPLVAIPIVVSTALVFGLFGWLTSSVENGRLRIAFGVGIIRKSWALGDLSRVEPVRNPWWVGWGIRFMPRRTVFNVSGFDAVEIETRAGKIYRIGTDDQRGLLLALQSAITPE